MLKGDAKEKTLIPNASGPPEIYGSFLKMIIVLGVLVSLLLIALYVVKRFFLKKKGRGGDDQNIRVITSAYVGPKKSIALVEVAGERIVVGITSDNISMLTKVSKDMEFNEVLKGQISSIPDINEDAPDEKPREEESDEKKVEINEELWEKA
ncbi:MAG: flagellar biosynthetic protein FliO [Nitrospira sp.]|nr:flagellar biosynthetic protein FliO [Nitrospira sp.]